MKKILDSNVVKIIAIIAMTIDHITWMIFYVAIYATVYFFAIDKIYGLLQMAVVLSIPIIMMYNGKRGNNQSLNHIMKWLFYIYYPLHLFVIGWMQVIA